MAIKRSTADKYFSDCVREAHDYNCENCGKNNRHNPQACHLSHFYGRRGRSTRWYKDNATCLCAGCHNYFGEHPYEHTEFIKQKLGESTFDALTIRANTPMKVNKAMEKMIADHYRQQLKAIKDSRITDCDGFIDYEGFV